MCKLAAMGAGLIRSEADGKRIKFPMTRCTRYLALFRRCSIKHAAANSDFWSESAPEIVPKTNPRRRSSTAKTRQKIALGNAVKPFGNSQKGIGNGRLTW